MNLAIWIDQHRASAFLLGTAAVQGFVLASVVYLNAVDSTPKHITAIEKIVEREIAPAVASDKPFEAPQPEIVVPPISAHVEVPVEQPAPATAPPVVAERVVKHQVQPGENLSAIWRKHGGSIVGASRAVQAMADVGIKVSAIRAGETLELGLDPSNDVVSMTKRLPGGKTLVLRGSSAQGYEARIISPEVYENERAAVGKIDASFSAAALKAEIPYPVIDELVDLFGNRVEFRRDIQPGDEFTVIYSERRLSDGELIETGSIRAASLTVNGVPMAVVRHVGADGKARYFDEDGDSLEKFFLRYPVQFSRVSSVFSDSRLHPVAGVRRPHNGVDFAAPTGTPVRAVGDGRVSISGYRGGAGYMVKIEHDSRYATAYLHLSRIAAGVVPGAIIKRGQVIGAVGSTGMATGPHLHFSLFDNGRYVDPIKADLPSQPVEKANMISPPILQAALDTLQRHRDLQNIMVASASEQDKAG